MSVAQRSRRVVMVSHKQTNRQVPGLHRRLFLGTFIFAELSITVVGLINVATGRTSWIVFLIDLAVYTALVVLVAWVAYVLVSRASLRSIESAEHYTDLFENTTDLIQGVDLEGRFLYVNRAWKEALGYHEKDLEDMTVFDVINPSIVGQFTESFNRLTSGEHAERIETTLVAKDGGQIIVEGNANCKLKDGRPVAVRSVFHDVSDRKIAAKLVDAQLNLALELSETDDLDGILKTSLSAILNAMGLDGGGVYIADRYTGALKLAHYQGLSGAFARAVGYYGPDTPNAALVQQGRCVYSNYENLPVPKTDLEKREGIKSLAIVPLTHKGKVVGCINVASRTMDEIPESSRKAIQLLAGQIGQAITRSRSISELRDSEAELSSVVETAADAIITTDTEGNIVLWNKGAENAFGYKSNEITGKPIFLLVPERCREGQRKAFSQMARTGGQGTPGKPLELAGLRKDGTEFRTEQTMARWGTAGGTYYTTIVRDVTERALAEDLLKRKNSLLEGISQILKGALVHETDVDIARASLAVAENLTGSGFGFIWEVNEEGLLDTLATSDAGRQACTMSGEISERQITGMEIRGIWESVIEGGQTVLTNSPSSPTCGVGTQVGHPELNSFLGVPLRRNGSVTGVFALANKGTGYDQQDRITLEALSIAFMEALCRKRAEQALKENEEKFRGITSAASDGIIVMDPESVITYWNPAAEKLFGYRRDEALGKSAIELLFPAERMKEYLKDINEFRKKGQAGVVEPTAGHTAKRKDGSLVPVEISVSDVRIGDAPRTVVTVRDITERKRAEEEIRRINQELGEFAHTVSHTLKGPLNAISLAGEFLRNHIDELRTDDRRSGIDASLDTIDRSVIKSVALITDLLALAEAGQSPKKVSCVKVSEVVQTVLEEQSEVIAEKNIEVRVDSELGRLIASPTHIYQIFSNLISNAIKHNKSEKPVIEIHMLGNDASNGHRYLVRDNGSGIPPGFMEQIFIPFQKGRSGGTGIGLSIAEKSIKAYQGDIKVYNDSGACFEFTLHDFCR